MGEAEGSLLYMLNVYEQVDHNKRQSAIIIAIFISFIVLSSYLIAYSTQMGNGFVFFALVFSLISSLSSFYYGDKFILFINQAIPASRRRYFNFYTATENLSLANNLPMPKIYVVNSPAPNAFATGRDPKHATVCATTGLLEQLNRTQLEGVIAHELSHVKNYDTRLMMLVSVLIGTISLITNISWRSRRSSEDNDQRNNSLAIIGFVLLIFSPLIAQLIQLAISRRREFLADASAVKLTRQPNGLIEALKIISSDSNVLATASTATASLYISNPFKLDKFASLFSTHPPITDRIHALEQMM